MRAFYSDTFVLPLPEQHRFPMTKYRLLSERLLEEGIVSADDLRVPEPIAWDDLRLIHDAGYVDAIANGTLPAEAQRRIGFPWSAMMVERSRRSVGATLAAARQVVWGARVALAAGARSAKVAANLAGGTHHAFLYEEDRLGRLKLTIEGLPARDRFVFDACRDRDVPVVVAMSGGYAPDVDAIVTIHSNTIREAVHSCLSVSAS